MIPASAVKVAAPVPVTGPSRFPAVADPANVETVQVEPDKTSLRIRLLPTSVTYTFILLSDVIPPTVLNWATLPAPSVKPATPVPAIVRTMLLLEIIRTLCCWLPDT